VKLSMVIILGIGKIRNEGNRKWETRNEEMGGKYWKREMVHTEMGNQRRRGDLSR